MEAVELDRVWHEPEVIIYSNIITPGRCCSGQAYEIANRRWYKINVNSATYDEEKMADVVEQCVKTYYYAHGNQPPFNVISLSVEDEKLQFDTKPNHVVARPIREKLRYSPSGEFAIPTIPFSEVKEKLYVGRAVDRCRWNGRDCAFKRIEFDSDVAAIDREIKSRKKFKAALALNGKNDEDSIEAMERRFNAVPILAVVIAGKDLKHNDVAGVLMPFGGPSLESLAEIESKSAAFMPRTSDIGVTNEMLRDLACGVRELALAGVMHGDINDRNTLMKPHEPATTVGFQGKRRLVLVDFGDVAPEYKNDAFALGELFVWCKEHCTWDDSMIQNVEAAAGVLKAHGDFDQALKCLSD